MANEEQRRLTKARSRGKPGRKWGALALWNEKDAILKERPFGLPNSEGNHGEDVKEYYEYYGEEFARIFKDRRAGADEL